MRAWASFFALTLAGCSVVVPGDQVQCRIDDDCIALGFDAVCTDQLCVPPPIDPVWGCLGMLEEQMPEAGVTHTYRQQMIEVISGTRPRGLEVRLCSAVDLDCATPVIDTIASDDDGFVEFSVMSGFVGYLEVTSDLTMPVIVPIGPIFEDIDMVEPIELVAEFVVQSLADAAGFEVDTTAGHALLLLAACDSIGRAGINFTLEPSDGVPFYLIGETPDELATMSDETGNAGVLNVPPGFVTFQSRRVDGDQFVSSRRVLIRQGTLTYVGMTPTPTP